MSFFIIFKRAVKEVYGDEISDSNIQNVIDNFNIILVGSADRDEDAVNYDYKNASINCIPNYEEEIHDNFLIDKEVNDIIKKYIIKNNWFENMMNEIHHNTSNDIYKITLMDLNNKNTTSPADKNKNNYVNFDNESTDVTNIAAGNQGGSTYTHIAPAANGTLLSAIKNIFNKIMNWWNSLWS